MVKATHKALCTALCEINIPIAPKTAKPPHNQKTNGSNEIELSFAISASFITELNICN
jgi:hypothetical protein